MIAGGFGTSGSTGSKGFTGEAHEISAVETAEIFKQSQSIIFVPGCGMAVAQAQAVVQQITKN